MSLIFEHGDQELPKGHAILYFRSPSEVLATYILVLPLMVDFTKYIPPLMAPQVKDVGLEQFSAFAMPPLPEKVDSIQMLHDLAQTRGDDLIYGGDVPNEDFLEAAQKVNEAVQSYAQLYRSLTPSSNGEAIEASESTQSGPSVGEIVYSLMNERDKLAELSKLVGRLRFATEGKDKKQVEEVKGDMRTLASHMPENYKIERLIEVASLSIEQGPRLTELYLERCYKLCDEDYASLPQVEKAILELQGSTEDTA